MTLSTARALRAAHDGPLVIVMNAHAGRSDVPETREQIGAVLDAAGRAHEFVVAERGTRFDAAVANAAQRAGAVDGVLVAVGGDGTINAVASAALEHDRPLGVVPQGTFNYFARALGIPEDVPAAAACLLSGRIRLVQVGCVNQRRFLVNASLGLYPQLLEDREAFLQQRGRNRVNALLSSLVLALRGFRQMNIESERSDSRSRTPTLFIGNNRVQLERLGLGAELLDALEQHRLVGLSVRPITTLQMLALVLRGALGRLGDADRISSFAFRYLTVQPPGRRRIKVAIDGEVLTMRTPVRIEVCTDPLSVLVPAPGQRVAAA